jgi:hypothetical protein
MNFFDHSSFSSDHFYAILYGMRKEIHVFGTDYNTLDGTCIQDCIHVSGLTADHAAALDYITKKWQFRSLFRPIYDVLSLSHIPSPKGAS